MFIKTYCNFHLPQARKKEEKKIIMNHKRERSRKMKKKEEIFINAIFPFEKYTHSYERE